MRGSLCATHQTEPLVSGLRAGLSILVIAHSKGQPFGVGIVSHVRAECQSAANKIQATIERSCSIEMIDTPGREKACCHVEPNPICDKRAQAVSR